MSNKSRAEYMRDYRAKKKTTPFSEIKRPETPERRARIDAIKDDMKKVVVEEDLSGDEIPHAEEIDPAVLRRGKVKRLIEDLDRRIAEKDEEIERLKKLLAARENPKPTVDPEDGMSYPVRKRRAVTREEGEQEAEEMFLRPINPDPVTTGLKFRPYSKADQTGKKK